MCFERKRSLAQARKSAKEDSFEIINHTTKTKIQNDTKHHSLFVKEATRFEKVRNEIFCLRSTESKAQKHPHISAACCCVSHQLLFSLSLSLFTFLSRKRERNTTNEDFRESDGQKQNERHTSWWSSALDERGIIDFPGDGISDLGKRERETDELFL